MAWATLGSFGSAGNNPGQFSALWGFGITADASLIYVPDGNVKNRIATFKKSDFSFNSASAINQVYSAAHFSDGGVNNNQIVIIDFSNSILDRFNTTSLTTVQTIAAPAGAKWVHNDPTYAWLSPYSGTTLYRYSNTNLSIVTSKNIGSISPVAIAGDANNLYLIGPTTCYIWSKSLLTQTGTFTINANVGSTTGSFCQYGGYLFVVEGTGAAPLPINVYDLGAKTLFSTIPANQSITGTASPMSVFVDNSGVYVTYLSANKVVVFNNDLISTIVPERSGNLGAGLKKPNNIFDFNRIMGGY